ncbi:Detected protein of confused Function [Hibiscus syriacus]|uniref:Detected protein of confused Function n=1 Tax=Hibiscus syriacus TaxID=106335 RepID=A0A6A3CCM5_HIBSY|nr:Detected protein of confused Function [Hibiscus syriacus]
MENKQKQKSITRKGTYRHNVVNRLTVLRIRGTALSSSRAGILAFSAPCLCEIQLRGFPVQTTVIPLVSSPEATPDVHSIASSFYLEEKRTHFGVGVKRHQIGTFKLAVGPEWGEGKPVILFNGWIRISKNKHENGKPGAELHLRVKVDPDPRYVFQFEDATVHSPQIVQLQGSGDNLDIETGRRERKGWKVKIHDLSGSAVVAAFITTPFVPSTGCDWVAKSNPGAWLILRPDALRPESWLPWGKLEAWRERGIRDYACCRFHLLSEVQDRAEVIISEIHINAENGGEFFIDTDKQMRQVAPTPLPSPQRGGDFSALTPNPGGFVMSCRVHGESKSSKPSCN